MRPLVAVAADLSIWGMIFIYSGPQNARVDYPLLGMAALLVPGCVLFLLYVVSIGIGAILRGNEHHRVRNHPGSCRIPVGRVQRAHLLTASRSHRSRWDSASFWRQLATYSFLPILANWQLSSITRSFPLGE